VQPAVAVHAFRKSVRRARALVRLLRCVLPEPTGLTLERALGDVARSLSELRNTEMLPMALAALEAAQRTPFAKVGAELLARQEATRQSGHIQVALERGAVAVQTLAPMLAAGLTADVTWETLTDGLRGQYRRTREALEMAHKRPNPQLIHDCRKCARDLRDQVAWLLPADEHHVARHADLAALVKDLGTLTDMHSLQQWTRRHGVAVDDHGTQVLERMIKLRALGQFHAVSDRARRLFRTKSRVFSGTLLAAVTSTARASARTELVAARA
jgi:CHAD domain-containing protein